MDLRYTSEQTALADSAGRFLADRHRALADADQGRAETGVTQAVWREFAALGWLGLPFSEEHGGIGGSMVDLGIVAEAFGKHLVVEPVLSTVVLAGGLIEASGDAGAMAHWLPRIAAGETRMTLAHGEGGTNPAVAPVTRARRAGSGWVLKGRKSLVLDVPAAGHILVSAATDTAAAAVFVLARDQAGLTVRTTHTVDGRLVANLEFDDVALPPEAALAGAGDLSAAIDLVQDRAIAFLAADAVGAMQAALDATVEYTKLRKQFGAALATNQVLRHRMVEMAIRCEEARSSALLAAIRCGDGAPPAVRHRAVSGAKVKVARAARAVAEEAVQIHGGIGVTDELQIGGYLKRAIAFEALFGSSRWHLRRYGSSAAQAIAV